jgi:hypothetical protein
MKYQLPLSTMKDENIQTIVKAQSLLFDTPGNTQLSYAMKRENIF